MSKTNKDKRKVIPPRGPAENLRPAGYHKTNRDKSRKEIKQELRKGLLLEEDF